MSGSGVATDTPGRTATVCHNWSRGISLENGQGGHGCHPVVADEMSREGAGGSDRAPVDPGGGHHCIGDLMMRRRDARYELP